MNKSYYSTEIGCDYWLLSDSYQEEVKNVHIIPSINSDHSAIVLHFNSIEEQRHGPS